MPVRSRWWWRWHRAGPSRAIRRRFLAAGCDALLAKPIDVHLFAQQLARELSQ